MTHGDTRTLPADCTTRPLQRSANRRYGATYSIPVERLGRRVCWRLGDQRGRRVIRGDVTDDVTGDRQEAHGDGRQHDQ